MFFPPKDSTGTGVQVFPSSSGGGGESKNYDTLLAVTAKQEQLRHRLAPAVVVDLSYFERFSCTGNYLYFYEVLPSNLDTIDIAFDVAGARIMMHGFAVRALQNVQQSYFGACKYRVLSSVDYAALRQQQQQAKQHAQSQEKSSKGHVIAAESPPPAQAVPTQPPQAINESELFLHLCISSCTLLLPTCLYSSSNAGTAATEKFTLEIRSLSEYFDLLVATRPVAICMPVSAIDTALSTHATQIGNDSRQYAITVGDVCYHTHAVYGPSQSGSVNYHGLYRLTIGDVRGCVVPSQMTSLMAQPYFPLCDYIPTP